MLRCQGSREHSSTGAAAKSNGSASSAPSSWKLVKPSSHQPSAWDGGLDAARVPAVEGLVQQRAGGGGGAALVLHAAAAVEEGDETVAVQVGAVVVLVVGQQRLERVELRR